MPEPLPNPVLMATIGGAHGIQGECRVRSFTENPLDLGAYGPLSDAKGNQWTIKSVRPQKNVVLVRFAEISDRTAAERANGLELFVDRSVLPTPQESDEFYLEDLEGLEARNSAGETIGRIVAVHNFGAGDILEIMPPAGASVMIPFSEAAVPQIDLDENMIVVDEEAAGLIANDDDKPDPESSEEA